MTAPIFGTLPGATSATPIKTAQELREALNKGFVEVTFTKTTGEQVTLRGTTDLANVPKDQHPTPKAPGVSIQNVVGMPSPQFNGTVARPPQDPNHITFYSPDRAGWRSLRFERLIQALAL